MEDASDAYGNLFEIYRGAEKKAKDWNLSPMQLFRYLDGQYHCNVPGVYHAWSDYLDQAQILGKALNRRNVLLPPDLGRAHDEVSKEYRIRAQRLRKEQQEREELALKAGYEELRKKLETKYAWASDGYVIRIPQDAEEIRREGRILQHCVAGYAERHMRGVVVILFLRKEKKHTNTDQKPGIW